MYICICIYVYVYVFMCMYLCVCIYVYVYMDKLKPKTSNYDIGTFCEVKCVDRVTKGAFKKQFNEVKYDILINS